MSAIAETVGSPESETVGNETSETVRESSPQTVETLHTADGRLTLDHLDTLESESIHIFREVVAEFERPVLLFSGGKDSVVMLHLAAKAFWPGPVPFPLLHVDTGHNFPEVLAYRDRAVAEKGVRLEVAMVQDYIDDGRLSERTDGTRNPLQTQPLLDGIAEHRFDAVFGGGRRDEEKARAKERIYSLRDEFGAWDPRNQRPELWNLYNGRHRPGEHVRVFPLSNWTELDVWRYIAREVIDLPELYYARPRHRHQCPGAGRGRRPDPDLPRPAAGRDQPRRHRVGGPARPPGRRPRGGRAAGRHADGYGPAALAGRARGDHRSLGRARSADRADGPDPAGRRPGSTPGTPPTGWPGRCRSGRRRAPRRPG